MNPVPLMRLSGLQAWPVGMTELELLPWHALTQ